MIAKFNYIYGLFFCQYGCLYVHGPVGPAIFCVADCINYGESERFFEFSMFFWGNIVYPLKSRKITYTIHVT